MKKLVLLAFATVIVSSCGKQNPEEKLANLNGYWEIKKVTKPDGTTREFTISTLIDFIEVKGDSGVRTKVKPQLDGRFIATDARERFLTTILDGQLLLDYYTPYDEWQETVLTAKDSTLEVVNAEGNTYLYKRYQPLNITPQ